MEIIKVSSFCLIFRKQTFWSQVKKVRLRGCLKTELIPRYHAGLLNTVRLKYQGPLFPQPSVLEVLVCCPVPSAHHLRAAVWKHLHFHFPSTSPLPFSSATFPTRGYGTSLWLALAAHAMTKIKGPKVASSLSKMILCLVCLRVHLREYPGVFPRKGPQMSSQTSFPAHSCSYTLYLSQMPPTLTLLALPMVYFLKDISYTDGVHMSAKNIPSGLYRDNPLPCL